MPVAVAQRDRDVLDRTVRDRATGPYSARTDDEIITMLQRFYTAQGLTDIEISGVQRMAARGNLYLFHIVEEIERRGMPTELALLPFVESAMQPEALSSAQAVPWGLQGVPPQ